MKNYLFGFIGAILMAMVLNACSKEDYCDSEDEDSPCFAGVLNDQYYTMKLDGTAWKAGGPFNLFIQEWSEPVIYEKTGELSYVVDLLGMTADGSETFLLQLFLSAERLANPIGSYPVTTDAEKLAMPGTAEAMLISKAFPTGVVFQTRVGEKGSPDAGILTITEFEQGDPSSKQKKFRRMKGTFALTLYEFDARDGTGVTGNTKTVKEGKFNLINAFNLK